METNLTKYFVRHGVILAIINTIIAILIYIMGASFFANNMYVIMGVSILVSAIYPVVSTSRYRKMNEGFMTLGQGFMSVFFTLAIAGLIGIVVNLILYNLIDPEYPKALMEKIIERTTEMMQKFNVPEDKLQETIDKMQAEDQFSVGAMLKGYLKGLAIYALYALIVGAIMKRNKPLFTPDAQ